METRGIRSLAAGSTAPKTAAMDEAPHTDKSPPIRPAAVKTPPSCRVCATHYGMATAPNSTCTTRKAVPGPRGMLHGSQDPAVYEVIDAYSEVFLGYSVCEPQNPRAQYAAYRMAQSQPDTGLTRLCMTTRAATKRVTP